MSETDERSAASSVEDLRLMLAEMDAVTDKLHAMEKEAYMEACHLNPDFAHSEDLRLHFLKVEDYNTGLAAHRMCQYFDFKLFWFGRETFARRLTLADIGSDGLEMFTRGNFTMLNQRDARGLKIVHYDHRSQDEERYLSPTAKTDSETQMNGITTIVTTEFDGENQGSLGEASHQDSGSHAETLFEIGRFLAYAAPLRIVNFHFVHHPLRFGDLALLLPAITSRLQGRINYFSHQVRSAFELRTSLANEGISFQTSQESPDSRDFMNGTVESDRLGTVIIDTRGSPPFHAHQQDKPRRHSNEKKMMPKNAGPVRLPSVLYLEGDDEHLSAYQCVLRQQIEAFEASNDDVQYNASRMNRGIVLHQVGLRCRHCAQHSEWERANGAVYYPGRLDMLYQASQNMAKNHLCTTCKVIPEHTRMLLSELRTDKRRATAGKEYWAQAARLMGIYEEDSESSKTGRLRYHSTDTANTEAAANATSMAVLKQKCFRGQEYSHAV